MWPSDSGLAKSTSGKTCRDQSEISSEHRAVSKKIFRGGSDLNIHYRYNKTFEVNFYEVMCRLRYISAFSHKHITMLVKF